jgi:hypothetical protein
MLLQFLMPILLQASDISQTVGPDILNKLGEWSAALVIIAYLIYQLISKYQRNKKESLKISASLKFQNAIYQQLKNDEKLNKEILNYFKIVSMRYTNEISEAQMRILVEKILEASKFAIKSYTTKIMKENHILGNEIEIRSKIKQYISNRYKTDLLAFREYYFKCDSIDKSVSDGWCEDIIEMITSIVFNTKSDRTLQTSLTNKFDAYKNQMLINLLNRKL